MVSKRIGFLTFLLWLVVPSAAFGQVPSWLDISPGAVYQPPGDPSCYTITVGGGESMTVDLEFYFEYSGPYYGEVALDGNGQAQICVDGSTAVGLYEFTGVQNAYYPIGYTPVYATLYIYPAPPPPAPIIGDLGATCDNWDCIWISGTNFLQDSYVTVQKLDWSIYQTYWGPELMLSPGMYVSANGDFIQLQLTNPTLLSLLGTDGVYVIVWNQNGTISEPRVVHSPSPVLTAGGTTCADQYCIWLTGNFPLNADVDFRIPGQNDVIPNAYSDLNVTATSISLRLNPSVRHDFDVNGLNAWVVNRPLTNWSNGYYIPPVDRAVIGNIESITLSGVQYYLNGWACAKTYPGSIDLHVYLGGYFGGGGTLEFSGTANLASEPGLSAVCNSAGSAFRFSIPIPHSVTQNHGGQSIYVHGISPYGLANSLIENSGTFSVPAVDHSITGWISGIVLENSEYYLRGWACARTYAGSINVDFFAGGPEGSGTLVSTATANQATDGSVASACNSSGTSYGFSILLPLTTRVQFSGQPIYVRGLSPFGLESPYIGNSGSTTFPVLDRSVTGAISGVVLENQQYYLRGWACAKTYSGSIDVHLYAGGPYGSGTFVTSATANQSSNPATTAACNTGGASYGFSIQISLALRQQFGGQTIFVHGISPFGLENSLIGNSGNLIFPSPLPTSSKEYIYIGDRLLAVDTTNLP